MDHFLFHAVDRDVHALNIVANTTDFLRSGSGGDGHVGVKREQIRRDLVFDEQF